MQVANSFRPFNTPAALKTSRLLPFVWPQGSLCTCSNCSFVNRTTHNYCTNCGYPQAPVNDRLATYMYRLNLRKDLLRRSEETIQFARNTLYVLSAICVMALLFIATEKRVDRLTIVILLIVAGLFTGLGRWSLTRPFTALLVSFLVLLTFIAINTWAEFSRMFNTSYGVFSLVIQVVCFIFLMRGLQAAYRADIMEEEFKI
ncbi:hypothetical protein EXU57_21115 [Segetibacter sp. 3557_3]|uniref:hypothetical protein n=1 Tax=Segetibacter sp. 3557_3 TaxID=2547429 RepID=UPI00105863CF|nr:hypothetical protein [Segetibacter sp. 3557_3]TDH20894.1 hypothetical protein EXU57_21115 [Segetibacter sp. 3557_3]